LSFQRRTVLIEYDLATLRVKGAPTGVPQQLKLHDLGPATSPHIRAAVMQAVRQMEEKAEHTKIVLAARSTLDRAQAALLKAAREKEPLGERGNTYREALAAYQAVWSAERRPSDDDEDDEDGLNELQHTTP